MNIRILLLCYPEFSAEDSRFIDDFRAEHDKKYVSVVRPHFTIFFPYCRLGIRQLELFDVDNLFEILSDPETRRFYPRPYSKDEAEGCINKSMRSYIDNGFGLWALILKTNDQFIGQRGITLQNIDHKVVPENQIHTPDFTRRYALVKQVILYLQLNSEKTKLNSIYSTRISGKKSHKELSTLYRCYN